MSQWRDKMKAHWMHSTLKLLKVTTATAFSSSAFVIAWQTVELCHPFHHVFHAECATAWMEVAGAFSVWNSTLLWILHKKKVHHESKVRELIVLMQCHGEEQVCCLNLTKCWGSFELSLSSVSANSENLPSQILGEKKKSDLEIHYFTSNDVQTTTLF